MAQTAAAPPATALQVASNGVGDLLLFPYWTTDSRDSLIAVGNAFGDKQRFVHVRVREGVASRDVRDFTVCLSPGDLWTAALTTSGPQASTLRVGNAGSCDETVAAAGFTPPPGAGQTVPLAAAFGYIEVYAVDNAGGGRHPLGSRHPAQCQRRLLLQLQRHGAGQLQRRQ